MMKIAFDLDDVLSSFNKIYVEYHNKRYGSTLKYEDIHDFYLPNVYKTTEAECLKRIFEFYHTQECDDLPQEDGALDLVKKLKSKGHKLYVVTARDPEISDRTHRWISKNFDGYFEKIIMTKQFSKELGVNNNYKKSDACMENGIELLVEDALHNAIDVASLGIKVIFVTKPWNKTANIDNPNIVRISSLTDFPMQYI